MIVIVYKRFYCVPIYRYLFSNNTWHKTDTHIPHSQVEWLTSPEPSSNGIVKREWITGQIWNTTNCSFGLCFRGVNIIFGYRGRSSIRRTHILLTSVVPSLYPSPAFHRPIQIAISESNVHDSVESTQIRALHYRHPFHRPHTSAIPCYNFPPIRSRPPTPNSPPNRKSIANPTPNRQSATTRRHHINRQSTPDC